MAEEKSKEILYEVTLREAFFYFAFLVIATIGKRTTFNNIHQYDLRSF